MKSVIVSAMLIAAVVFGSAVYMRVMENVSAELGSINSRVSQRLSEEDFAGASAEIERLEAFLDEKEAVLSAMSDHEEIDNIEMNISELKRYAEGGSRTDALSKSAVLDFLFEHLPKNYRLRLENIL